jgi:hypothetical protein
MAFQSSHFTNESFIYSYQVKYKLPIASHANKKYPL